MLLIMTSFDIHLPSSDSKYKLLNTFELIKAVSDTVFDMIKVPKSIKQDSSLHSLTREMEI